MKDDRVYFLHIRDAIARVLSYTAEGKEAFFSDPKTQDAVVRNLEIIGQAVKNLSAAVRTAHPGVQWKAVAGLRDKLIHEYFGVDMRLVWDIVERDLPPLKERVESILQELQRPGPPAGDPSC